MRPIYLSLLALALLAARSAGAAELPVTQEPWLRLPEPGFHELRCLSPLLLELTLITTKPALPARVPQWDFVDTQGHAHPPATTDFKVVSAGKTVPVKRVGFKRRVLYAPFKHRDLRIANYLYLELIEALSQDQTVEVAAVSQKLWPASFRFATKTEPFRWGPAIHVNQTGYLVSFPKKAMVGYYLGSLGELALAPLLDAASNAPSFRLCEVHSGQVVYSAELKPRRDRGFPFECYQNVLEADFSSFKDCGEYCLQVPGFGASPPFFIDDGAAGAFARAYALGIYHQRCGAANSLPYTRFTHEACHLAPAEVPDRSKKFAAVNEVLKKETANWKDDPRHTAPPMKDLSAALYPFVNTGRIDVSGGHHDAGDYSKYTINSAAFIHQLVFAVDVFPGVAGLDNLGLPESGNGKSDLLEEAKWEADFLAKMQDADGGFYFLVYPRDREYENDVLPDHGDPQVVFPKTTAATAAASAALAQCASSPTFKQQFPEAAVRFLEQAKRGWAFLERARAKFGDDGSYQKITHYGDYFLHDDEIAWAACELFLATGEPAYQTRLITLFDPANPATRMWSWWRLFDAYGNAVRSYAFAAKSGKMKRDQLNARFLGLCEAEIEAAGQDQLRRAQQCAYGTSFPEETKRARNAGWYFSGDAAFDLAVACQLDYPPKNDPRPKLLDALLTNLNYEQGCNPVNVCYLTGLGWKRQREIVHQYAQNDRRVLPPTGVPLGNIQAGFGWLELYQKDLGALSFPSDGDQQAPYPFYDRWGDSFNLSTEFVIVNQARGLACMAWLMAQTPLKNQPWKPAPARTVPLDQSRNEQRSMFQLAAPELDLSSARIAWEASGREPAFGKSCPFTSPGSGLNWLEAEAQLPDGRRAFAVTNFTAKPAAK